ncbi:hypothetical protein M3Y97_00268400 [Aphelenchoides bicaudatus]|nr:hypothetical protein M3Y97_00268400 [Aphelenchoides bicaudatus]
MRRSQTPSSQNARLPQTNDDSLRDILGNEEYQQALRAEQAFFERQRQIQADRLVAHRFNSSNGPRRDYHFAAQLTNPPTMDLSSSSSSESLSDESSESDSDNSDVQRSMTQFPFELLAHQSVGSLSPEKGDIQHENLIKTPIPYDGSPCSICLDDLPNNPVACQFCKNCIGCAKCLDDWSKARHLASNKCPLCRFNWDGPKPKIVAMIISETVQEAAPLNEPSTSEEPTQQPKKAPQKRNAAKTEEVPSTAIARNTRLAKRRRE